MPKNILFKGRVQGVGFRYTTQGLARLLGISGWVRNLTNGDVEVFAQAEESAIDELIAGLQEKYPKNIETYLVREIPEKEQFEGFTIRHDYF